MANVALLFNGRELSPRGLRFLLWLNNMMCNATDLRDTLAKDGLEIPSDELMDAEAELERLYEVKDALTNLPLRIMLVSVMNDLQYSKHDDQRDQHDTKDEDELESIQALIKADIALINECLV
jgi:hypothetical protein